MTLRAQRLWCVFAANVYLKLEWLNLFRFQQRPRSVMNLMIEPAFYLGVFGARLSRYRVSLRAGRQDALRTCFVHGNGNLTPKLGVLDLVTENPRVQAEYLRRVDHLLLDATTSMASLTSAISIVRLRRAATALTFVSLLLGVRPGNRDCQDRMRVGRVASIPRPYRERVGWKGKQRETLRGENPVRMGISRVSPGR